MASLTFTGNVFKISGDAATLFDRFAEKTIDHA